MIVIIIIIYRINIYFTQLKYSCIEYIYIYINCIQYIYINIMCKTSRGMHGLSSLYSNLTLTLSLPEVWILLVGRGQAIYTIVDSTPTLTRGYAFLAV